MSPRSVNSSPRYASPRLLQRADPTPCRDDASSSGCQGVLPILSDDACSSGGTPARFSRQQHQHQYQHQQQHLQQQQPRDWSHVPTRLDTGMRKRTPGQRAKVLFERLLSMLHDEWQGIRSLNLGVTSGTGVANDMRVQKLGMLVSELHMLVIAQSEAAAAVAKHARRLSMQQLQQLQVMLDTSGHSELSDYVRIVVFNISDPFAKAPVDARAWHNRRSFGGVETSPGTRNRGRNGFAGGTGPSAAAAGPQHGRIGPAPEREEFIRFAGYLPEGHRLAATAYGLYDARRPAVSTDRQLSAESSCVGDEAAAAMCKYPLRDYLGPCRLLEAMKGPPPPPPEQTFPDVEAAWRAATHTFDKEPVLDHIVMGDPMLPYVRLPEFKERHAAACAAALRVAEARVKAETHRVRNGRSTRLTPDTPGGGGPTVSVGGGGGGGGGDSGSGSVTEIMRVHTMRGMRSERPSAAEELAVVEKEAVAGGGLGAVGERSLPAAGGAATPVAEPSQPAAAAVARI